MHFPLSLGKIWKKYTGICQDSWTIGTDNNGGEGN